MSSKICKKVVCRVVNLNFRSLHRSFSANAACTIPTYEEIEEYTETIASTIHSWPSDLRDHFISTLHKAQANPKRNKNYNKINIPSQYLDALDNNKLRNWLPFVFVNDIVEIMEQIQESPILSLIKINGQMVSYNDDNMHHQQILDCIQSDAVDKMIWVRDIPKNVSDRKLLETFQKFGEISAITMDRHQSVRQQQWLKHKEFESKLAQKNELNKTIKKLKQKMKKNMINDYQQEYLKIHLNVDNNQQILRLIMAHLQHQFDLNDAELIDDGQTLLVPICSDKSASKMLSPLKSNSSKFYFQHGNIILSAPSSQEYTIRDELDRHHSIDSFKKILQKDGMIEMEITFSSKLESSIKHFILSLCSTYFNIDESKVSMAHFVPYRIPSWYRNMSEQTKSEFFSHTIEDTDTWSIAQRMTMHKKESDEDTTNNTNCNAFIYFEDAQAVTSILCNHTKIWGMVINGTRCRISHPPKQIILKNVPYDSSNPVRFRPYYTQSKRDQDKVINNESQYDIDGNIIPQIIKRSVPPELAHIPITSKHVQCCAPFVDPINFGCHGLKSVFAQSARFDHGLLSKEYLDARLVYEAPHLKSHGSTLAEKCQLLMKHSRTFNMGLPLIGDVIQNMLILNDSSNIWQHASCTYEDNELFWYFDDDVSMSAVRLKAVRQRLQNYELTVHKGRLCVYSKRYRKIDIMTHGLADDGEPFVYINGVKHSLGINEEAMILHKGWNNLLFDFGCNAHRGSFQIVDFNEKSEINDLYWRYEDPPINLILQFDNHLSATQMYDSLKSAELKRYGTRIELGEFDEHYLENNAILQAENINYDAFNGSNEGHSTLEEFASAIIENIHKSNISFQCEPKSKQMCEETRKYEQLLSEYSPSQMLQYGDNNNDSEYNNTTEMFSTSLNVPSTLELLQNINRFDC